MDKLRANAVEEQQRSKSNLQSKLEARRKRRKEAEVAKLEKHELLEADEIEMGELKRKQQEDALKQTPFTPLSGSGPVPQSSPAQTGNLERDWVNLLMSSPLFKQISELEAMLEKTEFASGQAGDKVLGMCDWSRENNYDFISETIHLNSSGLHPFSVFFLFPCHITVNENVLSASLNISFLPFFFFLSVSFNSIYFLLCFFYSVFLIIKALDQIKISSASKYIVFTDSLSCLQALHHMKLEHPLIGMVIRKCVFLNIAKKDIVFCWVPSHTGIRGNEKADSAAKSALDLPRDKVGVPYNDFKHCINQYILSTWQDDWNGAVMNKLHSVKPVLGEWQSSYRRCRKDEVVLCRARIGHTHLTHSYILKKDPPPVCEHCQCNLTVRHILVECNHFAQERRDIFGIRDVVESFRFQPTLIVLFLKQIKFYCTF